MIDVFGSSFQIARFSIPAWLVAGFIFYAAGGLLLLFFFPRKPRLRRNSRELMGNALIIGLLAWKLSPIFTSFRNIVQDPVALLYLPGGFAGIFIGSAMSVLYIVYRTIKQPLKANAFLKPLATFGTAGMIAVFLFVGAVTTVRALDRREVALAPEFLLLSLSGSEDGYTAGQKMTTVINFWASWCPPCRAEIPELITFSEILDPSRTRFLSVNLSASESSEAAIRSFAENYEITYIVLLDKGNKVANAYGIRALPTTVVVTSDGTIKSFRAGAVSAGWLLSQTD